MTDDHTDDHDRYRDWAAAYVLGALESAERAEYERHLATCKACQVDVNEFAAIPGLLAKISPDLDDATDPAAERIARLAVARADHDYDRLRTVSGWWRSSALASAAAAIALIAAIALGGSPDNGPDGIELAFESVSTGTVSISERPWGTSIELDLQGLPSRDAYQLWAIDDTGNWTVAASWTSTPGGLAKLSGAAAVATETLDRIVVTSTDRKDVLVDART